MELAYTGFTRNLEFLIIFGLAKDEPFAGSVRGGRAPSKTRRAFPGSLRHWATPDTFASNSSGIACSFTAKIGMDEAAIQSVRFPPDEDFLD